ncbi:MAG TPA: thioredoxin [Octadecabacter sp.]|nr:thioredoxin [Octadecabacter sp.]
MRMICPNCGAQYEVADDVIPESGRDVQCSNCGHTWFEQPGASEAAEHGASIDAPSEPEPEVVSEPEPEPEPEPTPEPEVEPESERSAPQQREMDPEVADILREEAEYEQAARQAEADPIETQPDLDLSHDPEEDRRSREARDRLARLRGEPEAAASVDAMMQQEAAAPRRALLPDIEEINSTLRPEAGPSDVAGAEQEEARPRSGFRRGFMLIVTLALIALAVYIFAPQLSAAVPQAEPILTSYVEWVNGLRIWLDGEIQGFIEGSGDATDATPEPAVEPAPEG